jgi:hypothetical protein
MVSLARAPCGRSLALAKGFGWDDLRTLDAVEEEPVRAARLLGTRGGFLFPMRRRHPRREETLESYQGKARDRARKSSS